MNTTEISKEAREAWLLYRHTSCAPTHDTNSGLIYAERAFVAGFHVATAELRRENEQLRLEIEGLRDHISELSSGPLT